MDNKTGTLHISRNLLVDPWSTSKFLEMCKVPTYTGAYNMEIFEAKEITAELEAAFQRLIPQLSSSNPAPGRNELQEMIDSPAVILLMARDEGELVGSLSLIVFRIPTGMRGWIEDVVVDEKCRGRGIGEKLTMAAIERAKEMGVKTVDLTSRPSREAANRLYQRVGFQQRHTNIYRYNIHQE
jgi:ribosomal protein S18 acetylase RimI-like enzyme